MPFMPAVYSYVNLLAGFAGQDVRMLTIKIKINCLTEIFKTVI